MFAFEEMVFLISFKIRKDLIEGDFFAQLADNLRDFIDANPIENSMALHVLDAFLICFTFQQCHLSLRFHLYLKKLHLGLLRYRFDLNVAEPVRITLPIPFSDQNQFQVTVF